MGVWVWWAYEVLTLMATYISTAAMDAQTIMRTIGVLTYMIPMGGNYACRIMIGKNIGSNNEPAIKHYFKVTVLSSFLVGLAEVIFLKIFERPMSHLFTKDPVVQEQMISVWNIFLLFVIFDCTQGVASACIQASSRQTLGAIITGINYFVIGIPIAALLVFGKDWGINGIWFGAACSVICNTIAYLFLFIRTDWNMLIQEGVTRRKTEMEQIIKTSQEENVKKHLL
jgi:MATE family multidrug resistance protein